MTGSCTAVAEGVQGPRRGPPAPAAHFRIGRARNGLASTSLPGRARPGIAPRVGSRPMRSRPRDVLASPRQGRRACPASARSFDGESARCAQPARAGCPPSTGSKHIGFGCCVPQLLGGASLRLMVRRDLAITWPGGPQGWQGSTASQRQLGRTTKRREAVARSRQNERTRSWLETEVLGRTLSSERFSRLATEQHVLPSIAPNGDRAARLPVDRSKHGQRTHVPVRSWSPSGGSLAHQSPARAQEAFPDGMLEEPAPGTYNAEHATRGP